jgi:ubiquinone biosynthesis O-methyltransferase
VSTETKTAEPRGPRVIAIAYGLACHLLFGLGVGSMIAAMFFGMSRSLGRVPPPLSYFANALLLGQFPIVHSLLLMPFGARLLRRLAPRSIASPLATTSYALIASIQVLLLFTLWTPSGTIWWVAEGPVHWLTVALYAIAWLLLLKAIWDAGIALQTGFLGWWAVAHDQMPKFPAMPTTGLFRLVRQPIYVAFALTLWTVPVWTPDQLTIAIVLTSYCLIGPLLKEKRFRQRFGTAFENYAQRVPYWLPWPRPLPVRNDLSIYDAPRDWWDGKIRWVRTLHNLVPARLEFFDKSIQDWHSRVVLDLGAGGGFMAEALALRGATVSGVDPSEKAVHAAKSHAIATGLTIEYRVGVGESLPFPPSAFDIVVCVDVLEHVTDLDAVIHEVRRVLRPNGVFLFDTINRTRIASLVVVTLAETVVRLLPRGTHDPRLFIRPEELHQKLVSAGFQVEPFVGLGPRGINRKLDVTFGTLPTLAVQYMGVARLRDDQGSDPTAWHKKLQPPSEIRNRRRHRSRFFLTTPAAFE